VTVAPRVQGQPSPEAAAIIRWIRDYSTRPPADNKATNLARFADLRHVRQAAEDAIYTAVVALCDPELPRDARLSFRLIEAAEGISKDTVKNYADRGKRLLTEGDT
jgi:hypothetical protein